MLLRLPSYKGFYRCVCIATGVCLIGLPIIGMLGQERKQQEPRATSPRDALTPDMYARLTGQVDQLGLLERQILAFGQQHHMIQMEIQHQTEELVNMSVTNAAFTQKLIDLEKQIDIHRAEINNLSPVANNERLARIEVFIANHEKEQQAQQQEQSSWFKLIFGMLLSGAMTFATNEYLKGRRSKKREKVDDEHIRTIKAFVQNNGQHLKGEE